jgi:membrane protein required for colicin V production
VSGFDQVLLGLLALSVLLGLWRGLISEAFALLGWIIALFLAWNLAASCLPWLAGLISSEWLRWPAAFAVIFIACMLVLALLRFLLRELISISGLSVLDRLAGGCFGVLRALVLAVLFVMAAGVTRLPQESWWRESTFAPPLETIVIAAKPWLPRDLAERIKY